MADIVLTSEQECALFEIRTWFVDKLKPVWRLKGYAGTGKTSLMKFILACDDFRTNKGIAVVAYTHKAASVLRKKGIPQAGTIHGLIYKPIELPNGDVIYDRAPKHEVADAYGLIVVDEASMVSKSMRADIESFGIPVLYVGDAGQLPPIENGTDRDAKPGQFMEEAESQLIQIHRQAQDSPIIRLATMIREGKRIPMGRFGKGVYIIEEDELEDDILLSSDQIIVGKNETRRYYNKLVRKLKGIKVARYPTEGERIMVLENNREFGLFNGMVLVSAEDNNTIHLATGVGITHKFYRPGDATPMPTDISHIMKHIPPTHGGMVEFKPYFDGTNPDITDIASERHFLKSKGLIKVDFSEAISCHKSQGSSYVKPIVIEEQINRDRSFHRKWLYTAVTRAEQKLILVRPSYNWRKWVDLSGSISILNASQTKLNLVYGNDMFFTQKHVRNLHTTTEVRWEAEMVAEVKDPKVGDLFSARHAAEYINPYTVAYYGAGYKTSKPLSFSICVMYVSNSYVFYNSVAVWDSGRTVIQRMQRMERKDLLLDLRTGNLRMVTSLLREDAQDLEG